MRSFPAVTALLVTLLVAAAPASANTSHAGWPQITGMLLMNKQDQSRPLDGRPGADPFDGTDAEYSCDGLHLSTDCIRGGQSAGMLFTAASWDCPVGVVSDILARYLDFSDHCYDDRLAGNLVPADIGHNELLGGGGDNVIHAGPNGDVIWGYYKPSDAPTDQVNALFGGAGNDFIYAGHGSNAIDAGDGDDYVKAHWGHGTIDCGPGRDVLYVSRRAQPGYKIRNCETVSHKTLGY